MFRTMPALAWTGIVARPIRLRDWIAAATIGDAQLDSPVSARSFRATWYTHRNLVGIGIVASMVQPLKLLRAATWSFLISALLVSFPGVRAANATQHVSAFFGPICISAFDLGEDLHFQTRNDLAERVSSRIRVKIEAFQHREVWAAPGCIQPDKPEFDRQLTMKLSVKRQKIKLDGRDWNLVVAGGVATNGLFQDHELQPVVIVQEESVSDDRIVDALVEFVDRIVVEALRRP
jgi:hypothetical protein